MSIRSRLAKFIGAKPPNSQSHQQACFSHNNEQEIIRGYLSRYAPDLGFCVDIGASDGVSISNTHSLFRDGMKGVAFEGDAPAFAKLAKNLELLPDVGLAKCMVTPDNVCSLFDGHGVPAQFAFLNLDIDGYDYFVLERILPCYRPALICAEINEKIPPPIKFTVKWDPDYRWGQDHFYVQSLSQLCVLADRNNYSLVQLHYNNAFLMANEFSPPSNLTPEAAYALGYAKMGDRIQKFPWNSDVEHLQTMSPSECLNELNALFSKYSGNYTFEM